MKDKFLFLAIVTTTVYYALLVHINRLISDTAIFIGSCIGGLLGPFIIAGVILLINKWLKKPVNFYKILFWVQTIFIIGTSANIFLPQ